jgi:hypothetical protein
MTARDYFGIGRNCALLAVLALICVPSLRAQDQPLGDVARQARAQRENAPHAAKVVTNDSDNPASAVNPDDPPPEVVRKAALALRHDPNHSCTLRTKGNSGPGWSSETTEDVAGNQRHVTLNNGAGTQAEWIVIGDVTYRKLSIAPWQKLDPHDPNSGASLRDATMPQVLLFQYSGSDLKLLRKDSVNGSTVLVYSVTSHSAEMNRTVDILVDSGNNLPVRTEMHSLTQAPGVAPIVWDEEFSCSYGTVKKIDPPL